MASSGILRKSSLVRYPFCCLSSEVNLDQRRSIWLDVTAAEGLLIKVQGHWDHHLSLNLHPVSAEISAMFSCVRSSDDLELPMLKEGGVETASMASQ